VGGSIAFQQRINVARSDSRPSNAIGIIGRYAQTFLRAVDGLGRRAID